METMAMGSFWGYDESIQVQELKSMLHQTLFELETVRKEAKEYLRINEENVKQLLYFVNEARLERDEARAQLQKLLNLPESPLYTVRGNSSVTVSDNISESYTHQSYGSSPVDSLIDMVSSPDLTNINMADSSNNLRGVQVNGFMQEYNCPTTVGFVSSVVPETDMGSIVINNLVRGKTLPEKGNLLRTVVQAGPLLKDLLLAGPLPQWRNPPPKTPILMETFNMIPVLNLNHHLQSTTFPSLNDVNRNFLHDRLVSGKRQRCQ